MFSSDRPMDEIMMMMMMKEWKVIPNHKTKKPKLEKNTSATLVQVDIKGKQRLRKLNLKGNI